MRTCYQQRTVLHAALACALLGTAANAQLPPPSAETAAAAAIEEHYVYRIGPGDELNLKFSYNPDLDDAVTVGPDGAITLRMIAEVVARDKTTAELSLEIEAKYAEILQRPELHVGLKKSANLVAYVGGEVKTPGAIPLDGRVTALQALLRAGGSRTSAKLTEVAWVRKDGPNSAVVRTLNMKAIRQGKAPDPLLQPYDILYVSRSKIGVANLFVEQWINGLLPRNLFIAYNVNTRFQVE